MLTPDAAKNERFELRTVDCAANGLYPWFTASLIPRAIAWVSTISATGADNVAPHSFTTVLSTDPPILGFVSMGEKDTLANIRATGEFVLNIGTERLVAAMNDSATALPHGVSEFDQAAINREPSAQVRPPRVAEAPVAFECRVVAEHKIGNGILVLGEVVHVAAARSVLADDGLPDPKLLAPLARLGRSEWSTLGDVIAVDRIRLTDWEAGKRTRSDHISVRSPDPRDGP